MNNRISKKLRKMYAGLIKDGKLPKHVTFRNFKKVYYLKRQKEI